MSLYGKRSTESEINELHLRKNLIVDNEDNENLELKGNEILISNSKNHDNPTKVKLYHYGDTTTIPYSQIELYTKNNVGGTTRMLLKQFYTNFYNSGYMYRSLIEAQHSLALLSSHYFQKFYFPNDSSQNYYINCDNNADLTTFLEKKYHFLYNNTQYDLIKEKFKIDEEQSRGYIPGFDDSKHPGKYELYIKDQNDDYNNVLKIQECGSISVNRNTKLTLSRETSNQLIEAGNTDNIQFNHVEDDIFSEWNMVNYQFLPKVDGYYLITGFIYITPFTTSSVNYLTINFIDQITYETFYTKYCLLDNLISASISFVVKLTKNNQTAFWVDTPYSDIIIHNNTDLYQRTKISIVKIL